jgi:hypothetical protein
MTTAHLWLTPSFPFLRAARFSSDRTSRAATQARKPKNPRNNVGKYISTSSRGK